MTGKSLCRLASSINIKGKSIGSGMPAYIIAEMACSHDGDFEKAKALIEHSANAGVDAVQLQFFSVKDLMVPSHEVYELLVKIEFSPEQWCELIEYARGFDMAVFACTYDLPSAALAIENAVDGIKLNSSDLNNPDMIKFVASSGIPFTLGTGASTLEEIALAIEASLKVGGSQLILMHGVQNFPTDIENANIQRLKLLKDSFNAIVGYQDHTDASLPFSNIIDLVAVGAGAAVIEKHITLDRSIKGTDYQAALEPGEMKRFIENIRLASVVLGDEVVRPLTDSDLKYRKFQKKSIVAACEIPEGIVITREMVAFMRHSKSPLLSPAESSRVLGKKASRVIREFEQIGAGDVAE